MNRYTLVRIYYKKEYYGLLRKEEFDKLSAIFSGVSYENIIIENNKHIKIN